MKLCHCGHPIIVLAHERQEGQPEPTECACCRTGVRFGPRLATAEPPATVEAPCAKT